MTAQTLTVLREDFYYLQFPRGEGMSCHTEPHREAPGLLRRLTQDPGASMVQSLFCAFCGKGNMGQGEWHRIG